MLLRNTILLLVITLLAGCASTHGVRRLTKEIDKVLADSIFSQTAVQVTVISAETGEMLYDRDGALLMHPASNQKLITSAAALSALPRTYSFRTELSADSLPTDSVLPGNLYLRGLGNPDLTVENIESLADSLYARGVRRISGITAADVSFFDEKIWGPGWSWDDEPAPYAPFISPLSVNDNCVTVTVSPVQDTIVTAADSSADSVPASESFVRVIDTVRVELDPPSDYFTVQTALRLCDTANVPLKITRRFVEESNDIIVEGDIVRGAAPVKRKLSVWRPELFAAKLLTESLQRRGVTAALSSQPISAPKNRIVIAELNRSIDSVIVNMNKTSDNLSAELLLRTLDAELNRSAGSFIGGASAVKRYLASVGADTQKCVVVDGSGMSYYNLTTPHTMVNVLRRTAQQKEIFPIFFSSLPIAGVDGTLSGRMKNSAAENNLRAKTGSFSGVSTLSGYVDSREKERLIFCISMQDFAGSSVPYRNAQDRIGILLAEFSRHRVHRSKGEH